MKTFLQYLSESLSKDITTTKSLVGSKGERFVHPHGHIDVQHTGADFSPRPHSVISFEVDSSQRNKGIGKIMLKHALSKYDNLGGQVSSVPSLKVFYDNGFRNPLLGDDSFDAHKQAYMDNWHSLYMAHKDANNQPYI